MGVDYYACDHCGETFPDCGTYIHCEHGHMIGPCCFPHHEARGARRIALEWPEDQMVDTNDYGDAVKEAFCPVCKAGGSTEQQLEKAKQEIARLNAIIEKYKESE